MMKLKRFALVICSVVMMVTLFSATAMADTQRTGKKLLKSVEIPIDSATNIVSSEKSSKKLRLSQYDDNGVKVYTVEGANTTEEKKRAFEILNNFMESGEVQQVTVSVNETNKEFYGNEFGYSQSNSNVMGYTWARYVAGKNFGSNSSVYDKTWGGSSGSWGGSGTAAYIKLNQGVTVNVSGASGTLTIGWPPSYSVTATSSSSTASWSSEATTGVNVLGAEHQLVEYNRDDVQRGKITSCVYTDVADVKVSSTVYKATSSVRFTNGL
ncbi:hypothetical protein M3201_05230 [Paenibacillus motobuensis]|uniref:hypothetical protein n=1 Tax=Paenibacillus TaxID=44249 RepID=UPI002040F46E|nr:MULTISPECIES: hypothetical protein [Paenibacillus]MCM3039098.1 hypothetical protein [Paenibacillus lutimineralis]MCM3646202.1 hypothetical protein [Paenibacillus motobuensis]